MRLWSIHPKYLDSKGLVALWRETLLAKNVLEGKTIGYKNHPQLIRFRKSKNPMNAINHYLSEIYLESKKRDYHFDRQKINWDYISCSLTVSRGQLNYEAKHLLNKLKTRDIKKYEELKLISSFGPHPIFQVVDGEIEPWEIQKDLR